VLKYLLADVADASGAIEAMLRFRRWMPQGWLPTLAYHRIVDDAEQQPFDRGVIDATPSEFERQIATLQRYFNLVGVSDLADHVTKGRALPDNAALVTFDDGYRECSTRVLPALLAAGARATFFVSTDFIEQRKVFWWDRISYLVRSCAQPRLELRYPTRMELALEGGAEPAVRALLGVVKSSPELDIGRFLDELAVAASVTWNDSLERRLADGLVMTWDDVKTLHRAGMDVQSHTRTHRILQHLRPEELVSELDGSRDDLEQQLGERVRCISYPVGRPISPFPAIVEAVRNAGYELGFSSGVGWRLRAFHPLDMGRILVDRELEESRFRALLAHPFFAAH